MRTSFSVRRLPWWKIQVASNRLDWKIVKNGSVVEEPITFIPKRIARELSAINRKIANSLQVNAMVNIDYGSMNLIHHKLMSRVD